MIYKRAALAAFKIFIDFKSNHFEGALEKIESIIYEQVKLVLERKN